MLKRDLRAFYDLLLLVNRNSDFIWHRMYFNLSQDYKLALWFYPRMNNMVGTSSKKFRRYFIFFEEFTNMSFFSLFTEEEEYKSMISSLRKRTINYKIMKKFLRKGLTIITSLIHPSQWMGERTWGLIFQDDENLIMTETIRNLII